MCLDAIPFFSKNQGYETTILPEEKLHKFRFLGYSLESICCEELLFYQISSQLAFICSRSTRETREQCGKSLQN